MFARQNRLRKNTDIIRVYRRGKKISTQHLVLNYFSNPRTSLRVAVVASKKLDKRATVRNRAKRRVREVLKNELQNKEIIGFDILVSIKTDISQVNNNDLSLQIGRLVKGIDSR
jgi:ribonuclease P protein component